MFRHKIIKFSKQRKALFSAETLKYQNQVAKESVSEVSEH